MKVISAEFGQAVQFIVMEEVRPPSPIFPPDFYAAIAERYRFVSRPTDIAESLKSGAKFNIGHAVIDGRHINIADLGIYTDGLLVTARHTDEADLVLEDFTRWATLTFGLREPQTKIPRRYSSNLVVEFEVSIDAALVGFNKISRLATDYLKASGHDIPIYTTRISVGPDPVKTLPGVGAAIFFIEPRAGIPFSSRRYYTGAPLRTDEHAEWLSVFENELLSKNEKRSL